MRWVAVMILIAPGLCFGQFDTLERIESDFLRHNEACEAAGVDEMTLDGMEYRVRKYRCGSRMWRLWEYRCDEGYWSRVFLLDQNDPYEDAYYLDRFASLHNGQPSVLTEAFRPKCGA